MMKTLGHTLVEGIPAADTPAVDTLAVHIPVEHIPVVLTPVEEVIRVIPIRVVIVVSIVVNIVADIAVNLAMAMVPCITIATVAQQITVVTEALIVVGVNLFLGYQCQMYYLLNIVPERVHIVLQRNT